MKNISSTSGNMGATYSQEFGPICLICPQLVGTWVQNIFRKLVPDFWRVMFQISRVNILRINKFRVVSCQNSVCQRVRAMSWPP